MSRPANFDRVARLYRWAEYAALGRLLEQVRCRFLDRLGGCREALLLGDGDGRFTAALLRAHPQMRATAVDASGAMLRLLAERSGFAAERLHTVQGSLPEVLASESVRRAVEAPNLVVSHFVLDCFAQAEVEATVRAAAALGGGSGMLWLLSDFGEPHRRGLRLPGRLYVRALYAAFGVLTGLTVRRLPDPQAALRAAGFRCVERHERLNGLLYSELWASGENPPRIHATLPPRAPSTSL